LVVLVITVLVSPAVGAAIGPPEDPEHPLSISATATVAASPERLARNGTTRR
jgi:hypothetical protein